MFVVYLDDLYVSAAKNSHIKRHTMICGSLGFTINIKKSIPPCQQLVFPGVHTNIANQSASISVHKLCEFHGEINRWQGSNSVSKKSLQHLRAHERVCKMCVYATRTYMQRLNAFERGLRQRQYRIRIPAAVQVATDGCKLVQQSSGLCRWLRLIELGVRYAGTIWRLN